MLKVYLQKFEKEQYIMPLPDTGCNLTVLKQLQWIVDTHKKWNFPGALRYSGVRYSEQIPCPLEVYHGRAVQHSCA